MTRQSHLSSGSQFFPPLIVVNGFILVDETLQKYEMRNPSSVSLATKDLIQCSLTGRGANMHRRQARYRVIAMVEKVMDVLRKPHPEMGNIRIPGPTVRYV